MYDNARVTRARETASTRLTALFDTVSQDEIQSEPHSVIIPTNWLLAAALGVAAFAGAWIVMSGKSWDETNAVQGGDEDVSFTACEALDLVAMHPADPDKLSDLPGFTDEEISELSASDVSMLVSQEFINDVMATGNRRHLFALGRVAFFHEYDDLAFDLLTKAASLGSAPANMYLADFYAGDLHKALELAVISSQLGFAPANEVEDLIRSQLADPNGGKAKSTDIIGERAMSGSVRIDTSFLQQRELIEEMLSSGQVRPGKLVLPESTPHFLNSEGVRELFGESALTEVVTKLYCYHLAIAIGDKARDENPAFLIDSPKLTQLVHADVSSLSRVGLATKELMIFSKGMPIAARLSVIRPIVEGLQSLEGSESTFDSLSTAGKTIAMAAIGHHKELKEAELFGDAVKHQAEQDANLIQAGYYEGYIEDVDSIYSTLSTYIRAEDQ